MAVRVDVDSSTTVAWRAFEHRLAAELVELPIGYAVELALPIGRSGPPPLVLRFKARPATFLMTAAYGLPARAGARPRPTPPAGVPPVKVFRRDREVEMARWTTSSIREAYGVIHPAFVTLVRTDAEGEKEERPGGVPAPAAVRKPRGDADAEPETLTESADELAALVLQTLESVMGEPIERDGDGDIPIVGEHGMVYVAVRQDRPVIEAFAILHFIDIGDLAANHAVVNQWNALSTVETYYIEGDQLRVRVRVLGRRFRPSSVITAVSEVLRAVAEHAAFMADQEPTADDSEETDTAEAPARPSTDGALTEEALTIMQLEAAEQGSVTPGLAARIYKYDCGRLLADIHDAEVEVISWRRSTEAARSGSDEELAEVCAGETAACQRTVDLLRAALRITVER